MRCTCVSASTSCEVALELGDHLPRGSDELLNIDESDRVRVHDTSIMRDGARSEDASGAPIWAAPMALAVREGIKGGVSRPLSAACVRAAPPVEGGEKRDAMVVSGFEEKAFV